MEIEFHTKDDKNKTESSETELLDDVQYKRGPIDYANKVILAPMVRVNTLPFRLLAKEYGADITYSEEIIALKLRQTTRMVNKMAGTIDFVKDGTPVYRTCVLDHPNVLQLGAASSVVALEAAQIASCDVDGVDLNMGCPKHFSVSGGMGAALLSQPDTVKDILSTLKRNLNNTITCKIRLLDTTAKTVDLVKMIEQQGVSAIAIHARHVPERPRDPAHWDRITEIVQSAVSIPIIVNGDVFKYEDIEKVRSETGVSSVMIARGAMWNASIFQPKRETVNEVITKYLKKCIDLDNHHINSKYTIMQMLQVMETRHPQEATINRSKNMLALSEFWGLREYCERVQKEVYGVDHSKPIVKAKKQKLIHPET